MHKSELMDTVPTTRAEFFRGIPEGTTKFGCSVPMRPERNKGGNQGRGSSRRVDGGGVAWPREPTIGGKKKVLPARHGCCVESSEVWE